MSILTILVTIGRELFPFLKEALLEGQTFRVWLKTNWLTFAWLVNTLVLVLMIAHLADLLTKAHRADHERFAQVNALRVPIEKMAHRNKQLTVENAQLVSDVADLSLFKAENEPKLEKYEEWMQRCGVNLENGQCRAVRQPVRPARAKPVPALQLPPQEQPQQPAPEKPGFLQRIKKMLSRDKPNEED